MKKPKWYKYVAKGFEVERDKKGNVLPEIIPATPKKKRGFKMICVTMDLYEHISHEAGMKGVTRYLNAEHGRHELFIKMKDNTTADYPSYNKLSKL